MDPPLKLLTVEQKDRQTDTYTNTDRQTQGKTYNFISSPDTSYLSPATTRVGRRFT